MDAKVILYPLFAMVVLSAVVAAILLQRRIAEMRLRGVHPQRVATSAQMSATLLDSRAADNFSNLFETPVMFYAAVLIAYAAQLTAPAYVALAWAYVVSRCVHTAIHCSYNRVVHRLAAFATSLLLLWALWGLLAVDLLVRGRG